MKKKISIIIAVLLLGVICLAIPASANAQTSAGGGNEFLSADMRKELSDFVNGESGRERVDRTPFSAGEANAAQYLMDEMSALSAFETQLQNFTYQPYSNKEQEIYSSQNVVSVYKSAQPNAKAVIIGANYDNQFGEFNTSSHKVLAATASHGAYLNGTGVATLLQLARRLQSQAPQLSYDVYIVFFGAGEMWNYGADKYVEEYMSASMLSNTLLMINLQRIGGDKTYIYSDEVRTDHNDYLFSKVEQEGLYFSKVPAHIPRMSADYIDKLQYVHMGMVGASASFANRGVPYANIFGGTFDTFTLGLDEMKDSKNVLYTENDTVRYLEENMTAYAYKMAETAQLVYATLTADDFISSIENTKQTAFNYSVLMTPWIASVIVIGIILICSLILVLVAQHFSKKYPYKPEIKRLKIAVFGMDYEQKNDSDIFIDIKQNSGDGKNPFDGY